MKPVFKPGKLKMKNMKSQKSKVQTPEEPPKIFPDELKTKDKIIQSKQVDGEGTIVTSDRSVLGIQTKFKQQLENGDTIILEHPITKNTEQRVITLVLGNDSILVNEPFNQQYTTYQKYRIKKQRKIIKGQDLNEEYQKKLEQIHKTKKISKDTVNVRVKKGTWSYQNKAVQTSKNPSRQQLLDIRSKLQKDKFCW